ncbi:MAG: hypothetical protein ACRD9R_10495, partial [Pyrinomonadaceae bacterium]
MSDDEARAGLRDVPDTEGARHFYERFAAEHPRAFHKLANEAALLSDVLALAAWSPLLGTTLLQQPDYVVWLARERVDAHVRTCEELSESLARFALTHTQLQPPALLARFRRRELLRTYLHDIRRLHTVVETTEELSNLADAALSYALDLARQELDNRHGPPLTTDERGRKTLATSCVVSLGKLGSRELNYASDIDLLFIYSADGDTSGAGERGPATNREYFNRLAEKIAQIVGGQAGGEGAAFRVDLRLRPHGRVGALSVSLAEAVTYYREAAQAWELQALLRARASAGDAALYARFAEGVRARVYGHAGTAEQALDNVRLAKQKIDRHHTERAARGYNVKLGRGGVREIEFVAQALQLAHGGRDPWLQAAHTLVALGRLADRGLIQEGERAGLSDAYTFLRRLEHRLQMEHGLQTHVVPDDSSRRALVARRMGFGDGAELPHAALDEFERALAQHTQSVRACFERVFGARGASVSSSVQDATPAEGEGIKQAEEATAAHRNQSPRAEGSALAPDAETAALHAAAGLLAPHVRLEGQAAKVAAGEQVARLLCEAAAEALNARRALTLVARFAASLDKSE